jgi:hypothetical protein
MAEWKDPAIPLPSPQIPNMAAAVHAVTCEQQRTNMPASETGRSLWLQHVHEGSLKMYWFLVLKFALYNNSLLHKVIYNDAIKVKLRSHDHSSTNSKHTWAKGSVTNLKRCYGESADNFLLTYVYCHVFWVPWLIITGSGLDDWIYWHFYYNYT